MNILFSVMFLILMNINFLYGFKKNEICLLNTSDLIQTECFETFHFKCNQKYCTKSKQACDDFNFFKIYMKAEINLLIKNRLNLMVQSIKACVKNDICIKSDECFIKENNLFDVNKYRFINDSKVCPCENNYSFKCDGNNKYCGIGKKACDSLIAKNTTFKKCGKCLDKRNYS